MNGICAGGAGLGDNSGRGKNFRAPTEPNAALYIFLIGEAGRESGRSIPGLRRVWLR